MLWPVCLLGSPEKCTPTPNYSNCMQITLKWLQWSQWTQCANNHKERIQFYFCCIVYLSILQKICNISKKYFSNDCSDHSAPTITKTGFSSIFACIVYLSIYPKYPILVKNILIIIIHFPYEHYDKWSFRQGCR